MLFLDKAGHKDIIRVVDISNPGVLRLFKRVFRSDSSVVVARISAVDCHSYGGLSLSLRLNSIDLLIGILQQVIADLLYTCRVMN